MAAQVRKAIGRALAVAGCAAILSAPAVLPTAAGIDVRAGFGVHAGFNPAAKSAGPDNPDEPDISLMRPPVFVRDCASGEPGTPCRYRLAPYGEALSRVTTAGPPPVESQHFAMVGMLVVALGLALALTGVFWRHLAVSVAPDEERGLPRRRRRR